MRRSFLLLLLAAMFTMVSCENNESTKQQQSEEELCINNLMAQCQNFDSQTLVQNLPGEWVIDSAFMYDSEWKEIVETLIFQGVQGLFHSPVRGAFHLSFTVLVHYRSLGSI